MHLSFERHATFRTQQIRVFTEMTLSAQIETAASQEGACGSSASVDYGLYVDSVTLSHEAFSEDSPSLSSPQS